MKMPGLRPLRSWFKQERLALRQESWRTTLLLAAPLLLALLLAEGARRLQEGARRLEQQQQQALNLLHWLAGEQQRTALDWAHWNDSLAFVEGTNPAFPSADMGTTALLEDGAVMAIWGPSGRRLAIQGATPADLAGSTSALQRCLGDVERKRRQSGSDHLAVLCPGEDQLYVGSIETISDNTSARRTDASLVFAVPVITPQSGTNLAEALRQLRSELVLTGLERAGSPRARPISPPLWTTGGQVARVLPPATATNTLPELAPLLSLLSAGTVAVLGLRFQWMAGLRRQLLLQRRSERMHSQRIRRMQRDVGQLLDQTLGKARADESGAFARLLDHQPNGGSITRGERPEDELAGRIEQVLSSARNLVLMDSLTDLPNRNYFLEQLEWEAEQCHEQGIPVALLFINVDKFKRINETYGHSVGDAVLQHVAADLRRLIQADDFLARFGGDEFGLILSTSQLSERTEASIRALAHQRGLSLLEQFHSRASNHPEQLKLSLSIGIALSDPAGTSAEELIRRSDVAMMVAKERSSSPISVFDISSESSALSDYRIFNALESDLSRAPERFQILFQPIVALEGHTFEVEALVRWENPEHPSIPPDMFIGLAERYRLIDSLGRLIVDRSLTGFRRLRQELVDGENLQLALNVSPSQLQQEGFGPWLLKQLRLHGIPPASLTVEVTESAVIETTEELTDNLASLRQSGVRLALDDFGTGFSSLRLLMGLRPDELKIDKSFVLATIDDALARQIVLLLQQLSQTLGLTLVAEGVEDATIRDCLIQAGVRCFQGYFFARPQTVTALIASRLLCPPAGGSDRPR
ncbi:MAG: EAL domain-containing protein [Cyanobium sp.]|nr:EAL domain-containing protein [Cyanobium sp.]